MKSRDNLLKYIAAENVTMTTGDELLSTELFLRIKKLSSMAVKTAERVNVECDYTSTPSLMEIDKLLNELRTLLRNLAHHTRIAMDNCNIAVKELINIE